MTIRTVGAGQDHTTYEDAVAWYLNNSFDDGENKILIHDDITTGTTSLIGTNTSSTKYITTEVVPGKTLTFDGEVKFGGKLPDNTITSHNRLKGRFVIGENYTGSAIALELQQHCSAIDAELHNPFGKNVNGFYASSASSGCVFERVIVTGFTGGSKKGINAQAGKVLDSTVYGCAFNIVAQEVRNTASFNAGDKCFHGFTTMFNCASSDDTATGDSSQINILVTDAFVDAAANDFTLKDTSPLIGGGEGGKNIGVDQSTVATLPIIVGFDGGDTLTVGESVNFTVDNFLADPTNLVIETIDGSLSLEQTLNGSGTDFNFTPSLASGDETGAMLSSAEFRLRVKVSNDSEATVRNIVLKPMAGFRLQEIIGFQESYKTKANSAYYGWTISPQDHSQLLIPDDGVTTWLKDGVIQSNNVSLQFYFLDAADGKVYPFTITISETSEPIDDPVDPPTDPVDPPTDPVVEAHPGEPLTAKLKVEPSDVKGNKMEFHPNNSMAVMLNDLKGVITKEIKTSATVTAVIKRKDGEPIGGQEWPALLGHVENGNYLGYLSAGMDLKAGENYVLTVTAATEDHSKFEIVVTGKGSKRSA